MRSAPAFLFAALLAVPALAQENPVTDGIALWLRADAGVTLDASDRVVSWQDQSADGFSFTHVSGVAETARAASTSSGTRSVYARQRCG
jgi:hypothetical protein